MIVGIATLISTLLFGGGANFLPVHKLVKGIGMHVEDKATNKHLQSGINTYQKLAKQTCKEQKWLKKDSAMQTNNDAAEEDVNELHDNVMDTIKTRQYLGIDSCLTGFAESQTGEWEQIVPLNSGTIHNPHIR